MWVVDTCVVLDVLEDDPAFGLPSAKLLERLRPDGLCVCPITMVELSAAFDGNMAGQKHFLDLADISYAESWTSADTDAAHGAWNTYVQFRRVERIAKRPVADLLIGGFARNRQGLVTRNPADFQRWFPELEIRQP